MKWFQHDSDALTDKKLMDLAMKYRAEGIGVYWTVVEKIAAKMGSCVTLELEEESYHLAVALGGMPVDRIDAILKCCEDLDLFDRGPNGRIRCLTLLKKLDNFTNTNPQMREMKAQMERFKRDYPRHFEVTSKSLMTDRKKDTYQESLPGVVNGQRSEGVIISEIEALEKALKNPMNTEILNQQYEERRRVLLAQAKEQKEKAG